MAVHFPYIYYNKVIFHSLTCLSEEMIIILFLEVVGALSFGDYIFIIHFVFGDYIFI